MRKNKIVQTFFIFMSKARLFRSSSDGKNAWGLLIGISDEHIFSCIPYQSDCWCSTSLESYFQLILVNRFFF